MSNLLYDDGIHKLYFFHDQPAEFISYVVPMLKPIKFSKRDVLYKIDDTIDEIYLISLIKRYSNILNFLDNFKKYSPMKDFL